MKAFLFSMLFILGPMVGNSYRMLHPGPWVLFAATWVVLFTHPPLPPFKQVIENKADGFSAILLLLTLLGTVFLTVVEFTYRAEWIPPAGSARCLGGIVLMIMAIFLRVWSIRILGSFFTSTVNVEEICAGLVERGPYRLVRHPSYLAMLLALVALCLMMQSTLCLFLTILLIFPSYLYRIYREERALEAKLGAKYRTYRKRTWKLIPLIL